MRGAIERVLIAVDPSPASTAACRAAAELASRLHAELVGMFIENADLIRSAELPITREIGAATGMQRPLSSADLEAQLRAAARRTRHALEGAARSVSITASFRVLRVRTQPQPPRSPQGAGPVRAIVDDPATAEVVLAAAATIAEAAGRPVVRIASERELADLDPGGPIVVSASSPLARDPLTLARLAHETGAAIAVVALEDR